MPPRRYAGSLSVQAPQKKRKPVQKRALNALAIADEEESERPKVRQNRLRELDDGFRYKRRRLDEEQEEDDDSRQRPRRSEATLAEQTFSEDSDSDGNKWQLGHVGKDDDSELDSDEAFGESDEERFEGFTFRGSSRNAKPKSRQAKVPQENASNGGLLEEYDVQDSDGSEGESLGEDAVDLATMLDNYDEENEDGSEQGEDGEARGYSESEDGDDATGLTNLSKFVSSLPIDENSETQRQRPTFDDAVQPEQSSAKVKLTIDDMLAGAGNEASSLKKSRKLLDSSRKPSKTSGIPGRLEAPLPKRQRDQLDRIAADKKAKETLERWVDTVKHNRRADHVSFPFVDPSAPEASVSHRFRPTSGIAQTDLEGAISSIIRESGLATDNGQDEEEKLQEFEELQMNKMPLEEVQRRRAALRTARDLMFREEIRAKRIKKIKSKAYRRVHRKERERMALKDSGIFGDGEISDGERERLDRRRAEERMGTRHRDSKWAKSIKQIGRAVWDDDARAGVEDMARRNDDLRRRIQGEHAESHDLDGISEASEDDDFSGLSDNDAREALRAELDHDGVSNEPTKGLSSMKFMKAAEAARKAQNDDDAEMLKRELAGEDPFPTDDSEQEEKKSRGRRAYGPQITAAKASAPKTTQNCSEFEEKGSDSEAVPVGLDLGNRQTIRRPDKSRQQRKPSKANQNGLNTNPISKASGTASVATQKRERSKKRASKPKAQTDENGATLSKPDNEGWVTVSYQNAQDVDGDLESEGEPEPTLSVQERLLQQAFGGDFAAENFEKEKAEVAEEEDEKVIDNALPGWGSWTGTGISKREQNRNKGKFLAKKQGIRPQDRKDAKLKNVIINEKTIKKNNAYLASALPFPYSTKDEYERSMRMPVGGEWNTKATVQNNVKPRVLVKPGRVITPIEKPLV